MVLNQHKFSSRGGGRGCGGFFYCGVHARKVEMILNLH